MGVRGEMNAKVGKVGAGLNLNGVDWSPAACLFVDDTVLLAESERELQRVVDQFHSVCSRRKLRVNAGTIYNSSYRLARKKSYGKGTERGIETVRG